MIVRFLLPVCPALPVVVPLHAIENRSGRPTQAAQGSRDNNPLTQIGPAAAVATTRLVSALLFGLEPTDPLTIAMATLMIIGVAALAGYLPARRASRIDPMIALRYE